MTSVSNDCFDEFAAEMHELRCLAPADEHALWLYAAMERLLRSTNEIAAADAIHAIWARRLAAASTQPDDELTAPVTEAQPEVVHHSVVEELYPDVTIVAHYPAEDGPECVAALLLLAGWN